MKNEGFKRYKELIFNKLQKAFEQEKEIQIAAKWITECLKNDGWIYTSGTGHSHMFAEEIFYRAGGFARVNPILPPELMLHESASESTEIERKEGYASELMKNYPIGVKDVFIISSNSGRNAVSIEMAAYAKERGAKVIAVTNYAHSLSVDSRHSSGLKLYEIADLYFDNHGEIGDAAIGLGDKPTKVGATSTVVGVALIQAIMVQTASLLFEEGITPEIFSSSNSDIGEEQNILLINKYKKDVKSL
ncbi:sugar isomerase domain-containing protein [Echinicola shivajiensis]|uniref:sugar isomerase domain-containing protein n=1 Tax=Echinicola shivajiensis TaxID=1035916 RepID=UPI001BFCA496|nr:SIS domain-containing protein [Echinicola shivajiensis]